MISSCYIHIPFCKKICSYCDFPKVCYLEKWIHPYLKALKKEIELNYHNEVMKTIYIGGGTPSSLTEEQLEALFQILSTIKRDSNCEFTIEVNADDITEECVKIFKKYGINRVSMGVQTLNGPLQKVLNRFSNYEKIKESISLLKKYGIFNINVDVMYAIPGETKQDLTRDLEKILSLEVAHISTYSLILEEHTELYLKNPILVDQDTDYQMYEWITKTLKKHGYHHYEISNFSKPGYESKHNITYWENERYYGFGLGASSYLKDKRLTNHHNLTKYINGEFFYEEEIITKERNMEYEMILGLRKIEGVSNDKFLKKYHKNIKEIFDIQNLIDQNLLVWDKEYLKIPEDKLYLSNEILINFLFL
jgi:oxygen-independent coproporphyrinogen-3 oxidase